MNLIFPLLVILVLVNERIDTGEPLSLSFSLLGAVAILELFSEMFNNGGRK